MSRAVGKPPEHRRQWAGDDQERSRHHHQQLVLHHMRTERRVGPAVERREESGRKADPSDRERDPLAEVPLTRLTPRKHHDTAQPERGYRNEHEGDHGFPARPTRGTPYASRIESIAGRSRARTVSISARRVVSRRRTPIATSNTKGRKGRSMRGDTGTSSSGAFDCRAK